MLRTWFNPPSDVEENGSCIRFNASGCVDYFVDPKTGEIFANAPFYGKIVEGDFTLTAKVIPEFCNIYDAGALMLYQNDTCWVKFAFELTDLGHKAAVSVVTQEVSDDANGEVVKNDSLWMRMTRKSGVVGLYCSDNGTEWRMVRMFRMNIDDAVECYAGIEAQSPVGEGCSVEFCNISLELSAVEDIRKGV